jgi:hypothetical protein
MKIGPTGRTAMSNDGYSTRYGNLDKKRSRNMHASAMEADFRSHQERHRYVSLTPDSFICKVTLHHKAAWGLSCS